MTQTSDTRKLLIVQVVRSVLYLLNYDTSPSMAFIRDGAGNVTSFPRAISE